MLVKLKAVEALVPIGDWWHLLRWTVYTPGPSSGMSEASQQKCRQMSLGTTRVHKRPQQHWRITKDPDSSQEWRNTHGPAPHEGTTDCTRILPQDFTYDSTPWVRRPIQTTLGGTSWGGYTHILFVNIFWAHILWTSIYSNLSLSPLLLIIADVWKAPHVRRRK